MKEIRLGKTTERLREYAQQFQDESLFSIIYANGNNDNVSLDLVASSADEANIWVTGLSCLIAGHGTPPSPAGKLLTPPSVARDLTQRLILLRTLVKPHHER